MVSEGLMVLDPGRVPSVPEDMPEPREGLLLGELGLSMERAEPGAEPLLVWLCTNVGTANAAIPTARNACRNLLFFIRPIPFLLSLGSRDYRDVK